ncbi:MAG: hypothetical protein NTV29_14335 [Planctomycetota bacterium]|nr:hypothetical protein [Planctomycetota bacterium]
MAVSDKQLILWLGHADPRVRSASLDLLSNSYASDPSIVSSIIAAWDQYGTESAFNDFPLISHLAISSDQMPLVLGRAKQMSEGRKITDRVCRCAGKLGEAISVQRASGFAPYLPELQAIKETSKIFFRVPIQSMQQRAAALSREPSSLELDFQDGAPGDIAIALESLWERGLANRWIREGIESWEESQPSILGRTALDLVSRHAIRGYEEQLLTLVDRQEATVADLATISLVRGRNPHTQSLIADRFQGMGKPGQLRSLDIIRRMRLEQSSKLIRFLLPQGSDGVVQNSARIAEVLLFDFEFLEEWLEAFLLIEDSSVQRVVYSIPIAYPLALEETPGDWSRIKHLLLMRLGRGFDLG